MDAKSILADPQFYVGSDEPDHLAWQRSVLERADPAFKGLTNEDFSSIIGTGQRMLNDKMQSLLQQHHLNEQMGKAAEQDVESVKKAARREGTFTRIIGGLVPGGGFIADPAAQMIEIAGGARQSYNPMQTAVEGAISMVPGVGSVSPLKGSVGTIGALANRTLYRGLEGAAIGGGQVAVRSIGLPGETTPVTAADLLEGMGYGAAFNPAFSALTGGLRGLPEFRLSQAGDQLNRAKGQMERAWRYADPKFDPESTDIAFPYIAAHVLDKRGRYKLYDTGDLLNMASETTDRFESRYLQPTQTLSKNDMVNIDPIISRYIQKAHAQSTPSEVKAAKNDLIRRLSEMESNGTHYATVGKLEAVRKDLNAELNPQQAKSGTALTAALASQEKAMKYSEMSAIRTALANHWESTTGDPAMRAKLQVYKSLIDSVDASAHLDKFNQRYLRDKSGGKFYEPGEYAKILATGAGEYSPTAAVNLLSRLSSKRLGEPDYLIKNAFDRLQVSPPFRLGLVPAGKEALAQPIKWRAPAATGQRLLPEQTGTPTPMPPESESTWFSKPDVQSQPPSFGDVNTSIQAERFRQVGRPTTTKLLPTQTGSPFVLPSSSSTVITPEPMESVQSRLTREQAARSTGAARDPYAPFRTSTGNVRKQLPPYGGFSEIPRTPEKGYPLDVREGIIYEGAPELRMPGRGGNPQVTALPGAKRSSDVEGWVATRTEGGHTTYVNTQTYEVAKVPNTMKLSKWLAQPREEGFPPIPRSSAGLSQEEGDQLKFYQRYR